jgi:chaperone modulatory protein CbpM
MTTGFPLARPNRLSLDSVARTAGVHPTLVRRFVAMDLLEASTDISGRMWFSADTPALIGRIVRLHSDLALNYAAIALVLELADTIRSLRAELTAYRPRAQGGQPWT